MLHNHEDLASRAGGTAQMGKCLQPKHKELSLDLRHPASVLKAGSAMGGCHPACEGRDRQIPGSLMVCQPSQSVSSRFDEQLSDFRSLAFQSVVFSA